jgi:Coenzyme PQQ synthesis protein D (PqqD).
MRIKKGYIVRNIVDCFVVVPVGERVIDFKGIMTLNDTGKFIWDCLANDIQYEQLLSMLLDEYNVDESTAKTDLEEFLGKARVSGVLEE